MLSYIRQGKNNVTRKAWRKLEEAERRAGLTVTLGAVGEQAQHPYDRPLSEQAREILLSLREAQKQLKKMPDEKGMEVIKVYSRAANGERRR